VARWYKAFICVKRPEEIAKELGTAVKNLRLQETVPVVRIQKRDKRERGEYYLFLGIDSEKVGHIPTQMDALLQIPSLRRPVKDPLSLRDIFAMTGEAQEIRHYARTIPYTIPHRTMPVSLSELLDESDDASEIDGRTEHYDQLLLWLSAMGTGSWRVFRNTCITLGLDDTGTWSRSILRRLRLLGHLECTPDGARWTIAPTALVTTAVAHNDIQTYVLCGRRDSAMLDTLAQIANVKNVPQFRENGPATVYVQFADGAASPDQLANVSTTLALSVIGEAWKQIADILPPLPQWQRTLQEVTGITLPLYRTKRFTGDGFRDASFDAGRSGLYEFWSLAEGRRAYTLFYDAQAERWLRGDTYALQHLARIADQPSAHKIVYNEAAQQLAISRAHRWPDVYERSLVLASGRLPRSVGDSLLYDWVPRATCLTLCEKLSLYHEEY
jgi:hypothetical protein